MLVALVTEKPPPATSATQPRHLPRTLRQAPTFDTAGNALMLASTSSRRQGPAILHEICLSESIGPTLLLLNKVAVVLCHAAARSIERRRAHMRLVPQRQHEHHFLLETPGEP